MMKKNIDYREDLKYDTCFGRTGIYKNKYSNVTILDYKEDE